MTGSQYDESQHPRTGDGKYAPKHRAEVDAGPGGVDLSGDEPDSPPVRLADTAAAATGLTIDESEFSVYNGFERIYVAPLSDGSGFAVAAQREEDVAYQAAVALHEPRGGFDAGDGGEVIEAEKEARAWLDRHEADVVAWARDTYGVEFTSNPSRHGPQREWAAQPVTVYADPLGPDATTDQVVEHASSPRMVKFMEDVETGEFYRRMVAEAEGHRSRQT